MRKPRQKQNQKREMANLSQQQRTHGDVDGDQEKTQREFPVPTRSIPVSGDTPWHLELCRQTHAGRDCCPRKRFATVEYTRVFSVVRWSLHAGTAEQVVLCSVPNLSS